MLSQVRAIINSTKDNHRLVIGVLFAVLLSIVVGKGLLVAWGFQHSFLGLGDGSTFYAFAHSIYKGEVMYEDFIHFRTPGSYFLWSAILVIIGDVRSSMGVAINFETLVLYPVLYLVATLIIFRKRPAMYLLIATACILLFPGVVQARAGLALLSVALYSLSFSSQKSHIWLIISGVCAGAAFVFGQETGLMAIVVITAGELLWFNRAKFIGRLKMLIFGVLIGVAPLIIYVGLFSSVPNFLYYVFYYSFILQPHYMNLEYPALSVGNLIYYIPFILYLMCFIIAYLDKKVNRTMLIILGFGILRLVTLLGRSDMPHLLFSIPEVFIIVPYFLSRIKEITSDEATRIKVTIYASSLLAIFLLAIYVKSVFLIGAPFIIIYAIKTRNRIKRDIITLWTRMNIYLLFGVTFFFFLFLLYPTYKDTLKQHYDYANRAIIGVDCSNDLVEDVCIEDKVYREVTTVYKLVEEIKPNTIFSFPIQPFYYSLAEKHGARFMTFEPQTTEDEQDRTIEELRKSKPEVVVFDVLQSHALSGALWKISNYLTANYNVSAQITENSVIWVMEPKIVEERNDKLAFSVYRHNKGQGAIAIQSSEQGLENAIKQLNDKLYFADFKQPDSIKLSLADLEDLGFGDRGTIALGYDSYKENVEISTKDGIIELKPAEGLQYIELHNETNEPIIWNNITLTD